MKVIHLLRKPCSEGTVAANVLRWGTGALNIDGTRVAHDAGVDMDAMQRQQATGGNSSVKGAFGAEALVGKEIAMYKPGGRWPANLVLQHLDGCRHTEAWACAEGCPVMALDAQSGVSKSTGGRTVTRSGGGNVGSGKTSEKSWSNDDPGFGDTGGASRFFKQFGG